MLQRALREGSLCAEQTSGLLLESKWILKRMATEPPGRGYERLGSFRAFVYP